MLVSEQNKRINDVMNKIFGYINTNLNLKKEKVFRRDGKFSLSGVENKCKKMFDDGKTMVRAFKNSDGSIEKDIIPQNIADEMRNFQKIRA